MKVQIKHISLSYFLVLIMLKAMAAPLIILHFQTNQSFVAKYLCVNRSKENSGCKGSCQLKKKLKATTETPQEQGQNTSILTSSTDFFEVSEEIGFGIESSPAPAVFMKGMANGQTGFSTDIFHPPSA